MAAHPGNTGRGHKFLISLRFDTLPSRFHLSQRQFDSLSSTIQASLGILSIYSILLAGSCKSRSAGVGAQFQRLATKASLWFQNGLGVSLFFSICLALNFTRTTFVCCHHKTKEYSLNRGVTIETSGYIHVYIFSILYFTNR